MKKINVAEILRNCPREMELNCTMYDNLYFDQIYDDDACLNKIGCYTIANGIITAVNFTEFGTFNIHTNSKCVIFPKGKTTWEGFVPPCKFKDGDVVAAVTENGESCQLFLLKHLKYHKKNDYDGYCYFGWDFHDNRLFKEGNWAFNRLATEEEKQKLFKAIKDNGYRWDEETKTLVKLIEKPKFKVGDKIVKKNSACAPMLITTVSNEFYYSNTESSVGALAISEQDNYELVPDKFDINTLTPFESRVLIRDYEENMWVPAFWGCILDGKQMRYLTTRGAYHFCIPYEGNEHLLGKTDKCHDFYKIWE